MALSEKEKDWVAPHAGAWIETDFFSQHCLIQSMSHPTRVRGLKPA